MTGFKMPAEVFPNEECAYRHLLGDISKERWQPFTGLSQTTYVPVNTRKGQGHALKVGDSLILVAVGTALYLDLNPRGRGNENLPYARSGRGVVINASTLHNTPNTWYTVKVWPENGHIGILAELNWRGSDGDYTVRLLVAPDIVVVAECDADPRQIKDDTAWRLALPLEYAEWRARNAFKEWLPRKTESSHDPRLARFRCANTQVMNVGGVRHRHDV